MSHAPRLLMPLLAATICGCLLGSVARGSDFPTPRVIGVRQPATAAPEVRPIATTDEPIPPAASSAGPRRPKIVRVENQAPIAPQERTSAAPIMMRREPTSPLDLQQVPAALAPNSPPPQALNLPTARTLASPRADAGPRVEATQPQPIAAASAMETAAGEGSSVRIVAKSVSASKSLPRVRVAPEIPPARFDPREASPQVAALQPMPAVDSQYEPSAADLERWFTPIDKVGILPQPEAGTLPRDLSGNLFAVDDRPRRKDWPEREFYWEAPELWHQPFYFDDVPLERYGQSVWPARQPWISGLRFYMTFPILPVKLWADPPFTKVATFGYYRPGSDNPGVAQRSRKPHGWGPWGYGQAPGAGSFRTVPPLPAWETTPQ